MKPTTFEIPQGCTRVTIEQHEDKVLTIFESKRFEEKDLLRYETIATNNSRGVCVEFKEDETEVRFKDGDIISGDGEDFVFIFKTEETAYCGITAWGKLDIENYTHGGNDDERYRFATESEKQQLFDALAKVGKKWNAEKKCIEELNAERWRAKNGEPYWYVDTYFESNSDIEQYDSVDAKRYEAGNYFQTEQQSKDFAERIKQLPR